MKEAFEEPKIVSYNREDILVETVFTGGHSRGGD
jgi:hypothetical protein